MLTTMTMTTKKTTKTVEVLREALSIGADWVDPQHPWYEVIRTRETIEQGARVRYNEITITTLSQHDTREEAEAALAALQQ